MPHDVEVGRTFALISTFISIFLAFQSMAILQKCLRETSPSCENLSEKLHPFALKTCMDVSPLGGMMTLLSGKSCSYSRLHSEALQSGSQKV